jgi:N6-L-threonylcarbamoyladenine synthase
MKVLGIESSCDETAMAIVNSDREVLSHVLSSQIMDHRKYGGVVPELASRNHLDATPHIYRAVMAASGIDAGELDAIAVTAGPGLVGGLLVGNMYAKGLALGLNKPIIAVNHLEGHALTARFSYADLEFPYLMLLVSGGHCQILEVLGVGNYHMLGKTRDDAVGEAFDKVAKMLGLPYPGGPIIEERAKGGYDRAIKLPVPIIRDTKFEFSFSGLKSAVKRYVDGAAQLSEQNIADVCATFQRVVADVLCDRVVSAVAHFKVKYPGSPNLVIAGGVAANQYIKKRIEAALEVDEFNVISPPIKLCTDNGIMIAWAGLERFRMNMLDSLDFEPRSRWPLEELGV